MRGRYTGYEANNKPHTSILPYLRAKEQEKAHEAAERKARKEAEQKEHDERARKMAESEFLDRAVAAKMGETYSEAIHKIVTGQK